MIVPDTRISLLERLHDRDNAAAWMEFCEVYERAIYRLAVGYGLQDADAREVSQEVLIRVSRQVHLFDPAGRGKFRSWLATIARNATLDQLRKNSRRHVVGSPQAEQALETLENSLQQSFETESRREQFRWACEQLQPQVSPQSWRAFWLTAVDGLSADVVAQQLSLSVGAVYVARCRVLAKLKALIEPFRGEPT